MDMNKELLKRFRQTSERAARAGGEQLKRLFGKAKVQQKGAGDLVTEADFASQKAIREVVLGEFPEHLFLGEEDDGSLDKLAKENHFCWVVDPLDGTLNYVHQLRSFSVSVALVQTSDDGDRVLAGTVFDPLLDECYSAAHGCGATLNGEPIHASDEDQIARAMLVCSFSGRVNRDSPEIDRFLNVIEQAGSVRRLGSAALNFCYIGCGRIDGYWATSVNVWDIAAGLVILQEAGAVAHHINGGLFDLRDPRFVVAATADLQRQMSELIGTD